MDATRQQQQAQAADEQATRCQGPLVPAQIETQHEDEQELGMQRGVGNTD